VLVRQTTDRVPLHTAQILKMALHHGPRGPAGNLPERRYIQPEPPIPSKGVTLTILAAAALIAGGIAGWLGVGSRHR
jgi:hypothetical protein